jgi:hypothetical protein
MRAQKSTPALHVLALASDAPRAQVQVGRHAMTQNRHDRDPTPHKAFVDGISRAVEQASLTALRDLGLNDAQIANYFSVEPEEVLARRTSLDIGDPL